MSDTFCSLPWIHLASHPHGGVTLCCVSDHTKSINRARNFAGNKVEFLDLNRNSVSEIMNSDYFKQTRLQMIAGEKPAACHRCYKEEEGGVRSKRVEENAKFGFTVEQAIAATQQDGTIPVDLQFIELRLGNLCNVKCVSCNPASSSKWSGEYMKLQQELKFVTKYDATINSSWTESDKFWDDLLEHSKNVSVIYVNGGEPTLVEKHWVYLEKLIEGGLNAQITLWYNINMTNVPDKLLTLWKQFKSVQVTCSIDDLGERNEYIRRGTKWETVIANLDKLQQETWIKLSVCQTIGWMNIYYLPEFHEFMKRRNLHVHMNFIYDPVFLSAAHLPLPVKDIVLSRSEPVLECWKVNAIREYLNTDSDTEQMVRGIKYISWIETQASAKYESVFNEMNQLLLGSKIRGN